MAESASTFAALKERNFLLFSIGSLISLVGRQMLTVAVGWHIYELTHSALALGYIGLAQFTPVVLLTLYAGHVVDTYDRRKILVMAQLLNAFATAGLIWLSIKGGSVPAMYACLFLAGIGRAFHSPANAALVPQVVSERNFTNAVTWGSINFQAASILGPAISGLILASTHNATLSSFNKIFGATQSGLLPVLMHGATPVYVLDCLSSLIFAVVLLFVHHRPHHQIDVARTVTMDSLLSGLHFVRKTRMILAAITLDMFAVLFGGAMALLPIYAKDILHVGPGGLGWLQAAPSIGAILMGLCLARMGDLRNAGQWLLLTVIGFGVATIVFGLSTNFWLSFFMLFLTGMFDNVSVIIRQALVQLRTPDAMRGRVSAINFVFIGTSNELGGFESGLVANLAGPVFSVVFGGVATIATVVSVALVWPELRNLDRLVESEN